MSEITESELPGIGRKFTLSTVGGTTVTVIAHLNGKRDVYFSVDEEGEPAVFSLTDEEARRLSAVLGDTFYKPATLDLLRSALGSESSIEVVKVAPGSPAAGRTLRELDIRRQTGASVLAIQRGDRTVPNPVPTTALEGGDLVVVLGTADETKRLERMLQKG